jgi:hypothetical protein
VRLRAGRAPVALAVLLAGAVLAGCHGGQPPVGEARLGQLLGRVEVASPGQPWRSGRPSMLLARGDRVRVLGADGQATLTMAAGIRLELRRGSHVTVGPVPTLTGGDLLVTTEARPVTVSANTLAVRVGDGTAARLSRALAFDAAAYRGTVTLSSAGRTVALPALRQATVPGTGLVPDAPVPLRYRESDQWDRRYLLDAMQLGDALEGLSRGITGQLPAGAGRTAGFYRVVLPALDGQAQFTQQLLDTDVSVAPTGERLVGAAIAVKGRRGDFASRWRATFSFRQQGAAWGLVALDQRVRDASGLVGTVDDALARLVGGPGSGQVAGPASATTTTATTSPSQSPSPTTTSPSRSPGATTTTRPSSPATVPAPQTGVGPVDQLVDPTVSTVNGLLSGLPVPPPPSQLP